MYKKTVAITAVAAFFGSFAPAFAFHGDCVYIVNADRSISVPETAGNDQDYNNTGTGTAEDHGAPLVGSLDPCEADPPFPNVFEIPGGANANPNANPAPNP